MRILSELVGGVVLLMIFAYGIKTVIEFITREKNYGISTDNANESADARERTDQVH